MAYIDIWPVFSLREKELGPCQQEQATRHSLDVQLLTTTSPKFAGSPVSSSTTSLMPSGGFLIRSRTSLDTRANVRGGKFSMETLPDELLLLYWRYKLVLAGPAVDDAMFYYLFLTEWDSADVSRKFVGDGDVSNINENSFSRFSISHRTFSLEWTTLIF